MSFELKGYCVKLELRRAWCIRAVGVSRRGNGNVRKVGEDEVCDGVVCGGSGG